MHVRAWSTLGAAFAAVCLLVSPVFAAPVNIDTFDLGTAPPTVATGPQVIEYTYIANPPIAETIGGMRRYAVAGLGGGAGVTTLWVNSGQAGLGTLTMASTYIGLWQLEYGYTPGGAPDDLNADLVGSDGTPNTGLLIEMAKTEYSCNLEVFVKGNGVDGTVSCAIPSSATPQNVFIPLSDFGGVDFHDIDQIALTWTGQPDGDYTVNAITANVPEPVTLMLLAASGLLGLRRRR